MNCFIQKEHFSWFQNIDNKNDHKSKIPRANILEELELFRKLPFISWIENYRGVLSVTVIIIENEIDSPKFKCWKELTEFFFALILLA